MTDITNAHDIASEASRTGQDVEIMAEPAPDGITEHKSQTGIGPSPRDEDDPLSGIGGTSADAQDGVGGTTYRTALAPSDSEAHDTTLSAEGSSAAPAND